MATFHVKEWLKLMILIDEYNKTIIFEQCLCVMFEFQLGSLQISKVVTYHANNNICFKFNVQDSKHYNTRKTMGGEL
jgi:hypothetical protein